MPNTHRRRPAAIVVDQCFGSVIQDVQFHGNGDAVRIYNSFDTRVDNARVVGEGNAVYAKDSHGTIIKNASVESIVPEQLAAQIRKDLEEGRSESAKEKATNFLRSISKAITLDNIKKVIDIAIGGKNLLG